MITVTLNMGQGHIRIAAEDGQAVMTIPLRSCDTSAGLLHYILIARRQPWYTPEALEEILGALDEAFLQAFGKPPEKILCPRGSSNIAKWADCLGRLGRPIGTRTKR